MADRSTIWNADLLDALEYDPFPYAPRLDPLKAILAKLEPPKPQPETFTAAETRHDATS